jgi:hypothetical protein
MMRDVSLETCWAIKKHWSNKFYYSRILLVISIQFVLWCTDPWTSRTTMRLLFRYITEWQKIMSPPPCKKPFLYMTCAPHILLWTIFPPHPLPPQLVPLVNHEKNLGGSWSKWPLAPICWFMFSVLMFLISSVTHDVYFRHSERPSHPCFEKSWIWM